MIATVSHVALLFGLAFFSISQTGCATLFSSRIEKTVTGVEGSARGSWQGKALVRDLRNGKVATLDLDILAEEPSRLRMEITGSFGVHIASIALDGDLVRSVLTQQKRYIEGPATSAAIARIVPVRISPRTLLRLLFDRSLDSSWVCERDAQKLPTSCAQREGLLSIKWKERMGETRRLEIGSPESKIEMVLSESQSKVEFNDRAFQLDAPDGYQREVIPAQ